MEQYAVKLSSRLTRASCELIMLRKVSAAFLMVLALNCRLGTSQAADCIISAGGTYQVSVDCAGLGAGDSIIFDGATNTSAVTLRIDASTPALGIPSQGIDITAAVVVTFQFEGASNVELGNSNSTKIEIAAGGSLAVTNGGGATGKFDFSDNTNRTLTINGPVTGTDAVNHFDIGNNTLKTTTNPVTLNDVTLGGANAELDIDSTTTIDTLTLSGNVEIKPADGIVVTITDAVSVGANSLTCSGSNGGGAEPINATITLNNASSQITTGGKAVDDILGDVTVNVSADGATLDVNDSTSPIAVNMNAGTGDLTLAVASGETLTTTVDVNNNTLTLPETGTVSTVQLDTASGVITANANGTITTLTHSANGTVNLGNGVNLTVANAFNVGANKLTLKGSSGGGQDTFTATVQLNNAASELEIGGADADNINGTTVTVSADGATLDSNINTTPTAVNMTAAFGDLTLEVATGKTMTTTVDVNDNTLTLSETGTVSTVQFDTAGGQVKATGAGTITTVSHSASATLDIDEDYTITNDLAVGAAISVDVAGTKTLSFTNNDGTNDGLDLGANTLTLSGTGTLDEITMDTSNGAIIVNADTTVSSLNISGSGTVTVSGGVTWTQDVDTAGNNFTVGGSGTLEGIDMQVQGNIRTLTAAAAANLTITDLMGDFTGAPGTLQIAGSGDLTVSNFRESDGATADLPGAGDKLQMTGSGTLTLTPGISTSFANGAGVLLDIDSGTVIIGAAGTNDDITFDDDADEITVASGATLTTFGGFSVGAAGANVNLDAAAGSIVNLSSSSGAETFAAVANNDFNLLGTVNINGTNSDYTISDAFEYNFGSVNINTTGSLINNQPNGIMHFVPSSSVDLAGNATLTINGQGTGTLITLTTTTGVLPNFTFDGNTSPNMMINNTSLDFVTYQSNTGGSAEDDGLSLTGNSYGSNATNWTAGGSSSSGGGGGGGGGEPPPVAADEMEDDILPNGTAFVGVLTDSGTKGSATIEDATEIGTVTAQIFDSNTKGTFSGMAGGEEGAGNGIPRTLSITTTLTPNTFKGAVEICLTDSDLATAKLTDEQIALYVCNEQEDQWEIVGANNIGRSAATSEVGDYGAYVNHLQENCVWAVVDHFSVFAAGEVATYTLEVTVAPEASGTVSVDPPLSVYAQDMPVRLEASPTSGYRFLEWAAVTSGMGESLSVIMNSDKSMRAIFEKIPLFMLEVLTIPEDGGSVQVTPDSDDGLYEEGTSVALTAEPANGYEFIGWSGDVDREESPLVISLDTDLSIVAGFEELPPDGNVVDELQDVCGAGAGCGASGALLLILSLLSIMRIRMPFHLWFLKMSSRRN